MKTILCRPQGGLNDMLCQIEKCCRYAEKTGRYVVVDSNYKHAETFHDDLSKYFVSMQNGLVLGSDQIEKSYWDSSTFPSSVHKRLSSYKVSHVKVMTENGLRHPITDETGTVLSFDFEKGYNEDILLHHQRGAGDDSLFFLLRVKLQKDILVTLQERLKQIGRSYSALHIRNTDYVTNYEEKITQFIKSSSAPYFLATDSQEALDFATSKMQSGNLFNFCDELSKSGEPLHLKKGQEDAYSRNRDAIVDLLMLALAQKLECGTVVNFRGGKVGYAGFSRLAMRLNHNKPILMHLIGSDTFRSAFPLWSIR